MIEFVVYILKNKDGLYYIGQTNNFPRRFQEHNDATRMGWASRRGPWEVLFSQKVNSRSEALKRERFLKSLKNKSTLLSYIESQKLIDSGVEE